MTMGKTASKYSWADEVEEEEQRQKEEFISSKRPNPFGIARPREEVLQKRGIDWRKLDEKHDQSFNLLKEKRLKKTDSSVSVPAERNRPSAAKLNYGEHRPLRIPIQRDEIHQLGLPVVSQTQYSMNLAKLVPPLMFPPRNVISLLEQVQQPHQEGSHCQYKRSYSEEVDMEKDGGQKIYGQERSKRHDNMANGFCGREENITMSGMLPQSRLFTDWPVINGATQRGRGGCAKKSYSHRDANGSSYEVEAAAGYSSHRHGCDASRNKQKDGSVGNNEKTTRANLLCRKWNDEKENYAHRVVNVYPMGHNVHQRSKEFGNRRRHTRRKVNQ